MKKSYLALSAIAFTTLMMSGCSKDGSSSKDDTEVTNAKLSGVAVDELILNGLVKVTDVAGNELQTGRTSNADGSYELQLSEYTGVTVLSVSCDADSELLKADNTKVACPTNTLLRSVATVNSGVEELTVHISPLTEIVYAQAVERSGGDVASLSTENIQASKDVVGQMFGFDPLATNPVTNTLASSAIASMNTLADANSSLTMMDLVEQLADELADGEANGAADETLQLLVAQMKEDNIENALVDNNGTIVDVQPTDPTVFDKITASRLFFEELRTQGYSVANQNGTGFLDVEADAMGETLDSITLDTEYLAGAVSTMIEAIMQAEDENTSTADLTIPNTWASAGGTDPQIVGTLERDSAVRTNWTYTFGTASSSNLWSGMITMPIEDVQEANETLLQDFTTLAVSISGTLPLDQNSTDAAQRFTVNLDAELTKKTFGASFAMDANITDNADVELALSNVTADIGYSFNASNELVPSYAKPYTMTVQGRVKHYTLDGSLNISNYVQNTAAANNGLVVEFPETEAFFQGTCNSGNIDNIRLVLGGTDYYPNYQDIYDGDGNNSNGFNFFVGFSVDGEYDYLELQDALTAEGCSMMQIYNTSTYTNSNEAIANAGYLPQDIVFEGRVENTTTNAFVEGRVAVNVVNAADVDLVEIEQDENGSATIPQGTIDITGKLQMPERPLMLITVGLDNTVDAKKPVIDASYSYDTTVVNLATTVDTELDKADVVITNQVGLKIDVAVDGDQPLTGTVTQDGVDIGVIEEINGVPRVKYVDGTFESLP